MRDVLIITVSILLARIIERIAIVAFNGDWYIGWKRIVNIVGEAPIYKEIMIITPWRRFYTGIRKPLILK